jgi:hypothetical protein
MSLDSAKCLSSVIALAAALSAVGASAQDIRARPTLRPIERPPIQMVLAPTEVVPPEDAESVDIPQSVTLRPGPSSQLVSQLQVQRTLDVASLRRNPLVQVGTIQADMRPVLQNPAAPMNVASRLRQAPQLVADVHDTTEVIEAQEGLLVRQFLAYRMLPGACTDRARRLAVSRAGGSCFTRMSPEQRAAARSDPDSPRYVAPGTMLMLNRNQVAQREQEAAEIAADIATLRGMLRNPVQRAQIEREIGAEQVARYDRLDDEQLEAELVNSGEIQREQTLFVPRLARQLAFSPQPQFQLAPSVSAVRSLMVPEPIQTVDAVHDIPDSVFLAGFTLGREHEWRERLSVTISWCVVGCKKTYYVEMSAGFDYGFGLRLPIEAGGTYSYHGTGNNVSMDERATLTVDIAPLNASTVQFESTSLPADQLFGGQELVAEVGAHAGVAYKVPVFGSNSVGLSVGHDFTDGLPAPFANGQFTPPAPGQASPPSAEKVFRNIDLIGGRANFGFVGVTIHPAVKFALTSDRMELRLTDNLAEQDYTITRSGQQFPLEVDPITHASSFSIGDPVYNLGFELTPGINVTGFIDVKLWGDEWDWPIWFPQMTITLPPGGRDFSCHAQTICARTYNYSPDVQEVIDAAASLPDTQPERLIAQWDREFRAEWLPRCPYQEYRFCEVAINWTAQKYAYRMSVELPEAYGRDVMNLDMVNAPEVQSMFATLDHAARMEADAIIRDSEEIR